MVKMDPSNGSILGFLIWLFSTITVPKFTITRNGSYGTLSKPFFHFCEMEKDVITACNTEITNYYYVYTNYIMLAI